MIDTKTNILQKSLELFLQKSYKEVTMRDIVDAVGLTKGAFYHYYKSKEEIFEECVKYFYAHLTISDGNLPKNSLKEFCKAYLNRLSESSEGKDATNDDNVLIFIMEAARKVPAFLDIHNNQRKKEMDAWTAVIEEAKKSKEITSVIPTEEIAALYLNISDGVALNRMVALKNDVVSGNEMIRDWSNLYKLLGGK